MLWARASLWAEMAIFTIRHITTYRYKRPVAFGEHRMMLRPRDDKDQKVLESGIDITPKPTQLSWTRDAFGNHVATALFAERASELRFGGAALAWTRRQVCRAICTLPTVTTIRPRGNTHAWVQIFIPGPGWVDLDPSSGVVGNQNLVRVAVAQAPREAIPLQGTWLGDAADHLTMKVAVKVSAATS
jgi:transglutaminase-like putative cysteine protease